MPFKFTSVCDLLQALDDIESRDPPLLPDRKRALVRSTVEHWFLKHRQSLDRPDTDGAAILSTLLPLARTDRVYSIKAPRLEKLIARCLYFRTDKVKELGRWREPGRGDIGECLEKVEKPLDCEPLPGPAVLTVEEVDAGLADIASRCRFSSPAARRCVSAELPEEILQPLLLRMHSREKKWFARLMLKDFGRLVLDENLVLGEFHFMLPPLLKFQNDFAAAVALLKGPLARYHAKPDLLSQKLMLEQAAQHLKPKVGVKIGRPAWYKARSISNCLQMVGNGTWIIERKYDGEFCEIHVDLQKQDQIQIFSKNGKDATKDRRSLLPVIRDSLKIGTPECQFNSKCVLLGEMVVFNQLENQVADFHKIRKHVSRSGSFLGTDKDSQPHPYENLMIFYFDILLVDDEVTMSFSHRQRRKRLSEVITKIDGKAKTVEWKPLDFSETEAKKSLIYQFSAALVYRCEGLILKPDTPFFSLVKDDTGGWCRGFIKLKKDYMTDMGGARDVGDFAVVAASYDVHEAQKCKRRDLRWTNFYLGCLVDHRNSYQGKPKFRVVAVVKATHCIPPKELEFLNQIGKFHGKDFDRDELLEPFSIAFGKNALPSFVFTEPLVVEVLGSSFEKPPNEDFYMLRHPRILRTHMDRSWENCITMQGLADMAREAKETPLVGESQELKNQVQRFMDKISRSRDRSSLASVQTTTRSVTTSTSPLATLKSVSPAYGLGTMNPAPTVTKSSRVHHNRASSIASIKTPSPATALIDSKITLVHTSVALDFAKEVTPVSQPSTQWTDTIVTSVASAGQNARQPLSDISPPERNVVVSDMVTATAISLSSRKEPRARATPDDFPYPKRQNTTRLREPGPDCSSHTVKETSKTPAGRPENAKDVSSLRGKTPEEELSFYEDSEVLSMKQHLNGLRNQGSKATNSEQPMDLRRDIPSFKCPGAAKVVRRRRSTIPRSASATASTTALKNRVNVSSQQKKDAEEVIERERSLKMTISTQTSRESEEGLKVQPKPTDTAQAYMLSPIPYFSIHPMPTPPKSSPNEPLSEKAAQPATASIRLPTSPPSSSPPCPSSTTTPPRATRSKENIPPRPSLAANTTASTLRKRRRAADDFDIGACPRKIPKWCSTVYGRPCLPPRPSTPSKEPDSKTTPEPDSISPRIDSLPLPYHLPHTCVYLAPSLRHYIRLSHTLLRQHFGVGAIVCSLDDWARETTVYESMGSTVGESQAFEGMRKVCLVGRGEGQKTVRRVREVLGGKVGGAGRREEGVGVFDWKVVEELVEGEGGHEGEGWERGVWEKWFVGVA